MVTTNDKYITYQHDPVSAVPTESLKVLITLFIDHAALNLGSSATKADVDRVIEFVTSSEFRMLPISTVFTAFSRGSLGKLKNEKITLNPRNIHDWLSEVALDYRLWQEHKERDERLSNPESHFKALTKYPMGKAIAKKIDWELTEDEWDKVPLKILAEMIGRNERVTMNNFGITR